MKTFFIVTFEQPTHTPYTATNEMYCGVFTTWEAEYHYDEKEQIWFQSGTRSILTYKNGSLVSLPCIIKAPKYFSPDERGHYGYHCHLCEARFGFPKCLQQKCKKTFQHIVFTSRYFALDQEEKMERLQLSLAEQYFTNLKNKKG